MISELWVLCGQAPTEYPEALGSGLGTLFVRKVLIDDFAGCAHREISPLQSYVDIHLHRLVHGLLAIAQAEMVEQRTLRLGGPPVS